MTARQFATFAALMLLVCLVLVMVFRPTSNPEPSTTMTYEEYIEERISKDVHCDRPQDVTSSRGMAIQKLCNFSKDSKLSPAQVVTMEIALYKGGHEGVSAYSEELIKHDLVIRKFMREK
jgi:hypothetical protein